MSGTLALTLYLLLKCLGMVVPFCEVNHRACWAWLTRGGSPRCTGANIKSQLHAVLTQCSSDTVSLFVVRLSSMSVYRIAGSSTGLTGAQLPREAVPGWGAAHPAGGAGHIHDVHP